MFICFVGKKRFFEKVLAILLLSFAVDLNYVQCAYALNIFGKNFFPSSSDTENGKISSSEIEDLSKDKMRQYNNDDATDGESGNNVDGTYVENSNNCDKSAVCKSEKNYAKLGVEKYSQKNEWKKYYFGANINWIIRSFNEDGELNAVSAGGFLTRFKNFDVHFGARYTKFLGAEYGYSFLGEVMNKKYESNIQHNIFFSTVLYTPMIDLKYTTLEGYASIGGAMLTDMKKVSNISFGAKFGAGIILSIYGPTALNIGVDYYCPFKSFSDKGFLVFKTGFNIYFG